MKMITTLIVTYKIKFNGKISKKYKKKDHSKFKYKILKMKTNNMMNLLIWMIVLV